MKRAHWHRLLNKKNICITHIHFNTNTVWKQSHIWMTFRNVYGVYLCDSSRIVCLCLSVIFQCAWNWTFGLKWQTLLNAIRIRLERIHVLFLLHLIRIVEFFFSRHCDGIIHFISEIPWFLIQYSFWTWIDQYHLFAVLSIHDSEFKSIKKPKSTSFWAHLIHCSAPSTDRSSQTDLFSRPIWNVCKWYEMNYFEHIKSH